MAPTPEAQAREEIDRLLAVAGTHVYGLRVAWRKRVRRQPLEPRE